MALVSVIVPVYNIEKYIDKCIESIRNQDYSELQIILVDDGSTDESGRICDKHAKEDSRIQVLHKENGGLSDARNAGIEKATGKYIAFVDGDDEIAPYYIKTCVKEADTRNADLLIFDYSEIEEASGRIDVWQMDFKRNKVTSLKNDPKLLLTTPSAWNKFYKRSLFEKNEIRFPIGRIFEDLATTPQLMEQASRIVYLASPPLYYYKVRQGSIMRSNQFDRSYKNRKKAFEDIQSYFNKKTQGKYQEELEYLCFLHCFFIPSKEIIYNNGDEKFLHMFREYAFEKYPNMLKNQYIKTELSKKDKILLKCLVKNQYRLMNILSKVRLYLDKKRKGFKNE